MPLQGEDVLAGPEDGFDALADGGQMRGLPRFIFAPGPGRQYAQAPHALLERSAGIALVREPDLAACSPAAPQEFEPHLPPVALGRDKRKRPGSAVRRKEGVQSEAPEVAGVRGAVTVVAESESRAHDRLPAAGTLHRRRVGEQEIVCETRALPAEDQKQPLQNGGETPPALEVAGLLGQVEKQMRKTSTGCPQEAAIRGNTHDGLRHAQGGDLGVGGAPAGVSLRPWQKIIGCAIDIGAEGTQVGVHRGLQADDVHDTVGFGPSASNPCFRTMFVESII